MSRHQDITFGETSQLVFWDCPEGRPSSVTSATVFRAYGEDTGTTESALGSPGVETNPNTTTDATAGDGQSNPRNIPLTATTGVTVGRTYRLSAATGEVEWPEIVEVVSADSALARNPLRNSFASGSTFASTRITATVDSTWVADTTNLLVGLGANPHYRIRWEYVVGGVTYVHDSYFSLVRYAGEHSVTPAMVDAMYPGYADTLPTYHRDDEGRRMIAEAFEQVRWDLHASDLDDAQVRSKDAINRAVLLRFGLTMAESGGDPLMIELRERRYREFFDRIFRVSNKVPVSTTSGGAGVSVPAQHLWSK